MTFSAHSFRELRHSALPLVLLIALAGIAGCGSDNSSGGMVSPPGWVVVPSGGQHAKSATLTYIANGGTSSCAECHGADLSGGTSKVSCFENPAGCHHGPVADWIVSPAQNHGVAAKKAPGSSGFASCQVCHGADFRTPRGAANRTCYSCHSLAPHPDGPWRSSTGSTHTNTEPSNAPVCAGCHRNNSPGTPGCFNSTLCHGEPAVVPHPVGSAWVATSPGAQPHANDAKATPGTTTGFTYCQVCHGTGTDFAGGSSGVSCYPCHSTTTNSPHASRWRSGDTYVHTTTAEGNAAVCAFCHLNGTNSPVAPPSPPAPAGTAPGCFNNTLCHNGGGGTTHAVPYNDPAHFGVSAAAFSADCGACHDDFAPSTKVGPVCRTCHIAASPLTSLNCTSCHGDPPSGATYPDVAGKHAVHGGLPGVGVCNPCHNGLDSGTLEHYNRANARSGKNELRVPPGDVAFPGTTYNAQSGTAAFDPANRTCSDVICHGGQATPDWQTATTDAIDVVNACTSCHVSGTTQYNSYFSGKHASHIDNVFGLSATTCKLCHDEATVNVTGHFQNLATPGFEQAPRETILNDVRYNGKTCNPQAGGLTGCHDNRSW